MINIIELTEICKELNCKCSVSCSLKDYTTFKIGGECRMLIDISSSEAAVELVKYLRGNNIKYTVIGRGSNILAADEGYDGVVLHFGNIISNVEINGNIVTAGAGILSSSSILAAI